MPESLPNWLAPGAAEPSTRLTGETTQQILGQIGVREHLLRQNISLIVLALGVVGVITAFSPDGGGGSTVRVAVILSASLTTVPVAYVVSRLDLAMIWWSRDAPVPGFSNLFIAYTDIGIAIVLFAFVNPVMSLMGCALFAIPSAYVAHFARPKPATVHLAFVNAVIIVFALLTWWSSASATTSVAEAIALLIAINGIVAMLWSTTADAQRSLIAQHHFATTDALTGVLNRRGFVLWTTTELMQASAPLAILLIDIDHYKQLNDRRGHGIGDVALIRVANTIRELAGPLAVVARVGGDEFAVAAHLNLFESGELAARLRATPVGVTEGETVTLTVGGAVHHHYVDNARSDTDRIVLTQLIATADDALIHSKQSGRDQIWLGDLSSGSWFNPNQRSQPAR